MATVPVWMKPPVITPQLSLYGIPLYGILLYSSQPTVHSWVTHDVIPSINSFDSLVDFENE